MLLTLYSLPEILFLKRHGLKGLYSWGVSWGVAYVPTMQLKKLATMVLGPKLLCHPLKLAN